MSLISVGVVRSVVSIQLTHECPPLLSLLFLSSPWSPSFTLFLPLSPSSHTACKPDYVSDKDFKDKKVGMVANQPYTKENFPSLRTGA